MTGSHPERSEGPAVAVVAGESLTLLPERVAFWNARGTLLIADPHFGKAASFRALGVPVPHGTTGENLARLDEVLARTAASRIVFLGDFLHAAEGRAPRTLDAVSEWRARHASIDMLLVRGNHDARAGDPPKAFEMRCVDSPHVELPFVLDHHPRAHDAGYVLAGHLHPGARLSGTGRARAWLPCFWFGARVGVLPAFGEFTGLGEIAPVEGDRVYVVAEESVIEVR
ncbi:MAG: metallophosphoesterase [Gemmatimonadetes bacterium]|nr:metallophosphoesterase [Gemmatimonadota bacterium]